MWRAVNTLQEIREDRRETEVNFTRFWHQLTVGEPSAEKPIDPPAEAKHVNLTTGATAERRSSVSGRSFETLKSDAAASTMKY